MSNHVTAGGALVVFPGALGDFVCLVPSLRVLRARHGEVTVICKGDIGPLARLVGARRVEAIEGRIGTWPFHAELPDEAVAFYGAHEAIHLWTGAGSPEVAARFARFGERARIHRFRPAEAIHLAVHYLRCVGAGEPPDVDEPDPALRDALAVGARDARALLIHPGSGGRSKRWSRAGFAALAGRWREQAGGRVVVLLGPAEEGERAFWVDVGDDVASGLEVVAAARLLARAGAYAGNDSGVSHLAGLVGAPGVALFGPTDPALWRPRSRSLVALSLSPWSNADAAASAANVEAAWGALADAVRRLDKVYPRH